MESLRVMLLGIPGFLFGIMLHESCHALAALKLGDPTARDMGRISLNPRRHFDLMGAIFYVFTALVWHRGFGWAKPVPINPYNFRDYRRDFALSSIAGPAANIVQAFVWTLLLRAFFMAAPAIPNSIGSPLSLMIYLGIWINVILAVFNMIPIPPLDGSRVLAFMLPERYARVIDRMEHSGIGMLIIFGVIFLFPGVLNPFFRAVMEPIMNFFVRLAAAGLQPGIGI
jgi:Zn-dependent protease